MAKLYFKVASNWEEVVRLRNEIEKLKQELKGMDSTQSPAAFKALNTQLSASTQKMDELVTNAAKAGAVMEGDFKKKIFDASQAVNGFTEKIIAQKAVVKDTEADVKRLGEAYRTALKRNPLSANSKLADYTSAKKTLDEDKAALFELTQQQANARLSVKKLRDEYSLYKNDGKQVVETNNGIAVSWKKALAVIGGATALKALVSEMIRVRGEFQSMQTAIETMVGKDVAGKLITQIKEMAKVSPLTLTDFVSAEKMMLGFNIESEKTIRYLQALSDISMGNSQKFNSLTLAFSQMSAAGKLMGQDLNQMINAGFNPLQIISEKTGKSIAILKDEMSKGAVSAEMVQQAFVDATSAGGKFYQMSENASKTINGQISMMQDAMDAAFNEMGQKSEGVIMKGIQMTTSLIENYETVGKVLAGLVVTYGAYRTAVMLVTAAESKHTLVEIGLTNARILARNAQLALNAAMLTNPYVLLATAVVGLGAAMWALHDSTNGVKKAQDLLNQEKERAIEKEQKHKQEIENLISVAQNESAATEDRKKALVRLEKQYPFIFKKYDTEAEKLKNILKIKKEIAKYEDEKSTQNKKENLSEIEKEISSLEKMAGGSFNKNGRSNILSREQNDRLIYLRLKRKELSEELNQQNGEKALSDLTGYSNKSLKASIDAREKLLAKLTLGNKKYGVLSSGIASGRKSKEELTGEIQILQSEFKRRNADLGTPSAWLKKRKNDYEKDLKALKELENSKTKYSQEEYEKKYKALSDNLKKSESAYKEYGGKIEKDKGTSLDNSITGQINKISEMKDKQAIAQSRSEQDMWNKVFKTRIDAMEDGGKKALEQMELDHELELQAIDREKEDLVQKKIEEAKALFDAEEELKAKKDKNYKKNTFDPSGIALSYTENKQFDEKYKNTIDKQIRERKEFFDQEKQYEIEYLKKYGTFQQKKESITKEYNDKIAKATTEGDKKILQKEMEESLSSLNMDKLKEEINWELIFGDLSKVSKGSLEQVKKQLEEFKNSDEYKNMAVDQKKVVDEALNNIQSSIIDKGGLLGDLPEQLDALRIAQKELKKAQDAYNESLKSGTDAEKEAALKKKNNAEKNVQNAETNVTKSADKTKQNLITLADTITQLGSSSEMSLSQIGSLAGSIVDIFTEAGSKIGGIIGAVFSLLDAIGKQGLDGFIGNIFSSLFNAYKGIWDAITFGGFSSLFGLDGNSKEVNDSINRLTDRNAILQGAIEDLTDVMEASKGTKSVAAYYDAKKLQEETNENYKRIAQEQASYWNSHHSWNYYWEGFNQEQTSRLSNQIGRDWNGDIWSLSPEEMKMLRSNVDMWEKIKNTAGAYGEELVNKLNDYIAQSGKLEELTNSLYEGLTGISFDSMYDSFIDTLMDMKKSSKDAAEDMSEYFMRAMLSNEIGNLYSDKLKEWWNEFGAAMENDGKLDKDEREYLAGKYMGYVNEAMKLRDDLAAATGYDKISQSSSSQSSTKVGFETMSQDTGGELNGRFTALQIAGEEIKNQAIKQTDLLSSISKKSLLDLTKEDLLAFAAYNSNVPNIASQARDIAVNSYQSQVSVVFPTDDIRALTDKVSNMERIVDEMRTNQIDKFTDISEGISKMAKNTPVMNTKLDSINDNIKKAL